ncbi:MAG: hypothetical protein IJ415_04820 [Clostridia bacterium]|nr:hypothetical protein [Clostridia bacterium]
MYYCKELYSLSVLSLYEGELLGKVDKLYFDRKLKKLVEIELVGIDGAKLVLPTKNIYHVGKNAITVKNNQAVLLKDIECENCLAPINLKAYSINGEFLGVVQEVSLNEKFSTEKISLDNDVVLDVDKLASCGKNTIIFYTTDEKINIKNFIPNKQPKSFKIKEVQMATTLPVEESKPNVVPVEKPAQTIIQTSDFLIGRVCTKDIFNFNNELLIKAHAVVNKKNLKEINKFGKLRELMLYLK